MKQFKSILTKISGILLGALVGLLYRGYFDSSGGFDYHIYELDLFSVTFFWVVPIAIGAIPILTGNQSVLNSGFRMFFYPIFSVLTFSLVAVSIGWEDWVCIIIILIPYFLVAGIIGLVLGHWVVKRNSVKAKKLYPIILLPLIVAQIETRFEPVRMETEVVTGIKIDVAPKQVWSQLLEVPDLANDYEPGIYQHLGVPGPRRSKVIFNKGKMMRKGFFTDGLVLLEEVCALDTNKSLTFKVLLDQSELRDAPTDRHVLEGNYFDFGSIQYDLEPTYDGGTQLQLTCRYVLNSRMNWYANFWARSILRVLKCAYFRH